MSKNGETIQEPENSQEPQTLGAAAVAREERRRLVNRRDEDSARAMQAEEGESFVSEIAKAELALLKEQGRMYGELADFFEEARTLLQVVNKAAREGVEQAIRKAGGGS